MVEDPSPLPSARAVDEARDYTALFAIVKRLVGRHTGRERSGMMLGLAHLGISPGGFLGGYFVVGSNAIVLNRDVLGYVRAREPAYHNAYAFHVLLHEYLHTLGYLSEEAVRPLAFAISREALGDAHPATRIARAMAGGDDDGGPDHAFFRELVFPAFGSAPARNVPMEIVKGFDPDSTPYIA